MDAKKNVPLIVGLAIPLLMIIFVAASIYLPALFVKPQFDFIYSTYNYPTYYEQQDQQFVEHTYYVSRGKLAEKTRPADDRYRWPQRSKKTTFYIYDVETDTNQELTFEQAQVLTLDTGKESPDGFEVTYGRSNGGVFPFAFLPVGDNDKYYLKANNYRKEISVKMESGSSYRNFKFIGWIVE
jgi:hypothetical protein